MTEIYESIKCALADLIATYWTPIDVNLKSALIGVFSALVVAYLTDWQERRRSDQQQQSTEQNKLKYLHFLVEDSFKVIDSYDRHASNLRATYQKNPFDIPDANLYVAHSLNTIANKINQEDYYLSSVNQIKDDGISELLLIYNTLHTNYTFATDHYLKEFPSLVHDKDKYESDLHGLIEAVNIYIGNADEDQLTGTNKLIYHEINGLMGMILATRNNYASRNEWLRDSKAVYVDQLIKILDPRGEVSHRQLMLHAYRVRDAYNHYVGYMGNVVEAAEKNQRFMGTMVERVKLIGKPLDDYVKDLKK